MRPRSASQKARSYSRRLSVVYFVRKLVEETHLVSESEMLVLDSSQELNERVATGKSDEGRELSERHEATS